MVYIDADTLIFHDVAEFFSVDIGEHVLGAVLGRLMSDFLPYVRDVLKFPLEDYFNAGILVINLPKFRRLNIGKRALSMLHSPKYLTRDQDVLNILCHHDVQYLDGRWNVEQQPLCFPEETPFIDAGREGSLAYLEAPFILHYASPRKPWNVPEYPKADLWWREARHAGFAHDVAAWMRKKEVAPISSHRNVMAAEALVTKRG